jgi:hypothetical protein
MFVGRVNQRTQAPLGHKRERVAGEPDAVDERASIVEQLGKVRLRDGRVVRPADLG